jgi:glyoxylase-like metal-dependent hydrolase (beta-lactamase superfamily II)
VKKAWRCAGLIAILVTAALAGCASSEVETKDARSPAPPALDGYLSVVERVAPGVHMMRQAVPNFAGVVGNVTIIEQAQGIVLVDSGASHGAGKRVVEAVRRISSKPVTAVIITHWHGDHPLGLSAIREVWPDADIIATTATRDALAAGANGAIPFTRDSDYETSRIATLEGYSEALRASAEDPSLSTEERAGWARAEAALPIRIADVPGTHVVLPERIFEDSLTLADPTTPVEARFEGRANTAGDAVVFLPRQRILIAGDAVVWPIPYEFDVFPAENVATLERLRAYDFRILIPGHGEALHDKRYLDLLIAFMHDVRAQMEPLARQGLTVEEATARLSVDSYAEAFAGDDPWLHLWFRDYALAPFAESAFREAKGEPLGPQPQ